MIYQFWNTFDTRILIITLMFLAGFGIEKLVPAKAEMSFPDMLLNCACGFLFTAVDVACTMLVVSLFVTFSWAGMFSLFTWDRGELIYSLALSAAWLILRDFFYYWFHRWQHASEWLWAEHALHHSDEQMNITTAVRHHWLEMPLNSIFVTAPLLFLFRPPALSVPFAVLLTGTVGYLIHLNLRVNFGRFGWLFANPHNHRIHHSRESHHIDKNFAQFFPLWDVLFGTYYAPKQNEFPETGLMSGEQVTTLRRALTFPFSEWDRMLRGPLAQSKKPAWSRVRVGIPVSAGLCEHEPVRPNCQPDQDSTSNGSATVLMTLCTFRQGRREGK